MVARSNYRLEVLRATYHQLSAQLARLANVKKTYGAADPRTKLRTLLLIRYQETAQVLRAGNYPLAYEMMYGIALGIDGLRSEWGTPSFKADDDDD